MSLVVLKFQELKMNLGNKLTLFFPMFPLDSREKLKHFDEILQGNQKGTPGRKGLTVITLLLLKFKEGVYFVCVSFMLIHVIRLNFVNHEANDYFPECIR